MSILFIKSFKLNMKTVYNYPLKFSKNRSNCVYEYFWEIKSENKILAKHNKLAMNKVTKELCFVTLW